MRTLSLLLLFSMALLHASGQPGSLDPSFGNKGVQTATFFNNANTLEAQGKVVLTSTNGNIFNVIQVSNQSNTSYTRIAKYLPDGRPDSTYGNAGYSNAVNVNAAGAVMQGDKIIVAGSKGGVLGNNGVALARYTANGRLDSTFGVNGKVPEPFSQANAIVLQGNKIVVAGYIGGYPIGDFALARYTANGSLDSTFGVNGKVITDLGGDDFANAIAVQGNEIIVAGSTSGNHYSRFVLAHYTATGVFEGVLASGFGGSADYPTSMVLQGNKIVIAGYTGDAVAGNSTPLLARYKADGTLDTSFGKNGKVTPGFGVNSITLQGYKVVAAGVSNGDFALARYTINGALDLSFGVNGKESTDFYGSTDQANTVVLQGDKIIAAGYAVGHSGYNFALSRYTTNGKLDASFGKNGKLTGYFPTSQAYFTSTVIQGNKVIAAGYSLYNNGNNDFALARYTAAGSLDPSFGINGKVATDFYGLDDQVHAIMLQGDKILAAGYATDTLNSNFALARYTANGSLDSSFGVNGKVFTHRFGQANAMVLQGDKILVAGAGQQLTRYTANGKLDSSFGKNGIVTIINLDARSIVLQGDKIIVAGSDGFLPRMNNFALARYTANGSLDMSFGKNGKVSTDFNRLDDIVNAIALQGDKIIVAGYTYIDNFNTGFALARYTINGTLDSSFGKKGKVITDFNSSEDRLNAMVLRGDTILAAGYTTNPANSNNDFALARYTINGALDSSFGVNGKVLTHLGGSSSINALAVQANRLYAVGGLLDSLEINSYGVVTAYQLKAVGPTKPAISIADVTVCESQKQAVLTVHLSAPSTQVVQADFHTHNITAYPTRDYLSTKWTLQFAPGTTTSTIKINIVNDSVCEPTEQFEVLLSNAQNAILRDSIGIVTITDDDCRLTTMQESNELITKQEVTSLHIKASPNPSIDAFTVQLQGSDSKQQVSIRVYDVSGRLLEQREDIAVGQVLHLGDQYKAGTYIIEAIQGSQRVQTKVIKTGK